MTEWPSSRTPRRCFTPSSICWATQNASVETPGAITVQAHLLFDIARKLPDGSQVSLETAENRMTVTVAPGQDVGAATVLTTDTLAADRPLINRALTGASGPLLPPDLAVASGDFRSGLRRSVALAKVRLMRLHHLMKHRLVHAVDQRLVGLADQGEPVAGEPLDDVQLPQRPAAVQAVRLARWHGWRCWPEPLVLVLHAFYAFLPLGLLAVAAAALGWAAVLPILADPRIVADAGFQLSALATAGILAWASPLNVAA